MSNGSTTRVLVVALLAPVLAAQSRPAEVGTLAFDVASVKTNKTGSSRAGSSRSGGRWTAVNMPAAGLFLLAYPSRTDELVGAPSWARSERFDVDARASFEPSPEQERMMLRALLADRFKFAAHFETRERPTYNLVIARADGRLGPQLRRIDLDCATYKPQTPAPGTSNPPATDAAPCSFRMLAGLTVTMVSGGRTLQSLADSISASAGRPVFDKTGLAGYFAFTLEHSDSSTDGPSLFTALQEQLGLKLEPTRGPVEVLVIDHVERPTED
jgi:uncharacterized protein (TIGR03435 family)